MSLGREEMSRLPRYSMLHEMSERLGPGHISELLSLHDTVLGHYLDGVYADIVNLVVRVIILCLKTTLFVQPSPSRK